MIQTQLLSKKQNLGIKAVINSSKTIINNIYILSSADRSVSFNQNSSMWSDRLDSRSWDRNLVDSNANPRFYHSATRKPAQAKEI